MKVPLPPQLSAAIAPIQWLLTKTDVPMYYEPMRSLRALRHPNTIPSQLSPLVDDIPMAIRDINLEPGNKSTRHYSTLSLALIFLGHGLLDEAHNLITPLSWEEDTYFGGPSETATVSDDVLTIASYAHSLLHRREGFAKGEFGMMGYQSADYWADKAEERDIISSTRKSNGKSSLPLREVQDEIFAMSIQSGEEAQEWCQQRGIEEGGNGRSWWENKALHEFCVHVSAYNSVSEELKEFAEKVAEAELRVLLRCSLDRAGYDCDDSISLMTDAFYNESRYVAPDVEAVDDNVFLKGDANDAQEVDAVDDNDDDDDINATKNDARKHALGPRLEDDLNSPLPLNVLSSHLGGASTKRGLMNSEVRRKKVEPPPPPPVPKLDNDLANVITNKISFAHRNHFQSRRSLRIRSIGQFQNPTSIDAPFSVAAALACRLIGSPACKLPTQEFHKDAVYVILPSSESESIQLAKSMKDKFGPSFRPLAIGDAFAFTSNGKKYQLNEPGFYTFLPCSASDKDVLFKDKLHGSRWAEQGSSHFSLM